MTAKDIFAVMLIWLTSLILIAGSTQIHSGFLSVAQFVLGIWFAVSGAINSWMVARK